MNSLEKLRDQNLKSKEDEKFILEKIQDEKMIKPFVMSLESKNVDFALFNIFSSRDYDAARNNFYRAGSVSAYSHEKFNSEVFMIRYFQHPILSDSERLITRFSRFDKSINKKSLPYMYAKVIQSLLSGDLKNGLNYVLELDKLTGKGWQKFFKGSVVAFKGLIELDKNMVMAGISQQIDDHPRIETVDLWKEVISLESVTLAKLAIRFGFNINFESKLIPKEFLPIRQLDRYEGYLVLESDE